MNHIRHFPLSPPRLLDIDSRDARLILAARSWCMLRNARIDPLPRILAYLMSGSVAMRFAVMMDTVQQVWPEPLAMHRPCCGMASVDEALLVRLVVLATSDLRPQFDELLSDMLNQDARSLLFGRAQMLYQDVDVQAQGHMR